jgi:hypothetical protein
MPSIGESGLPARQGSVERSAAVLVAARLSATNAPIFGSQASRVAMQRSRKAVFAVREIRRHRKKRLHSGLNRIGRVHSLAFVALHFVQAPCLQRRPLAIGK